MLTIHTPIRQPVVMRSRLMLEVASELVAADEWIDKQVVINFRPQGAKDWNVRSWPAIYVLDRGGIIRYRGVRGSALDQAVNALLQERD